MCMCLFRKKRNEKRKIKNNIKHDENIKESVQTIRTSFAKARTLSSMTSSSVIKQKLNELANLLEYSAPSTEPAIVKEDNKISDKLDDIKILISGEKGEEKILDRINDVRIMIMERNNLLGV